MPTSAEALERLQQSQNKPLQWLLGDLLVSRAGRPDWHECGILQQLAAGSKEAEGAWNGLIDRFRQTLANHNDAPMRAKEILNPMAADFDGKLDDLVAEMVAAVYLSGLGYSKFDFCPPGTIAILEYGGIEPDLNREQKEALERLIDELPGRMCPDRFNETLPGDIRIAFSLRNGNGVMMTHGPGGPLEPVRMRSSQNLTQKLMAPMGRALSQLYSPAIPLGAHRVIVLRWKVPDDEWLVEEGVRQQVGAAIQQFLGQLFPDLEVYLVSSSQQI